MKRLIKILISFTMLLMLVGCDEAVKNKYTIYYYGFENQLVSSEAVEEGSYTIQLNAPFVEGYIFEGWLLDDTLVSEIEVKEDCSLYAKYYQDPNYIPNNNIPDVNYVVYTEEAIQYVEVGEKTILRWNYMPEDYSGHVEVICEDSSILKIDNKGNCEGLKEGTTVVTVEIENSTLQFVVEVLDPNKQIIDEDEKPTIFELLSDEVLYLPIYSSSQIKINVSSDREESRTLIYTSDYPDIATVDSNGLIKTVGYGTGVIRVSTKDGLYGTMIIIYINGDILEGSVAYPDHQYRSGEFLEVYLNYIHFYNGAVSTTNGFADENLKFIVDEGEDVFEFYGSCVRVIEPYTGDVKFHFEINGVSTEILTVHLVEG